MWVDMRNIVFQSSLITVWLVSLPSIERRRRGCSPWNGVVGAAPSKDHQLSHTSTNRCLNERHCCCCWRGLSFLPSPVWWGLSVVYLHSNRIPQRGSISIILLFYAGEMWFWFGWLLFFVIIGWVRSVRIGFDIFSLWYIMVEFFDIAAIGVL